ncbi:MAG: 2-oxo acid dehydrogenase subunit E2 [Myxococcaceae bacterium]
MRYDSGMAHLELVEKKNIASFRKLAIGTWRTAYDPSVYGSLTVRMEKALQYIDDFRAATGRRLTVTHLLTKACASALKACPDANAIMRFNKIYLRSRVNISVLVVQTDQGDGKVDLTAAKIEDADQKTLLQIADEMQATIDKVRQRKDKQLESGKSTVSKIPFMLMNGFLKVLHLLMYTFNINLEFLGMPRDAFGGLTITNVGSLGLDVAFVPLVPYTAVPIFIAPGAIKDEPVVQDGQVIPGKTMAINATFDHRFIDGYHASVLSKTVRQYLEDPYTSLGPPPKDAAFADTVQTGKIVA